MVEALTKKLNTWTRKYVIANIFQVAFLSLNAIAKGRFKLKNVIEEFYNYGIGSLGIVLFCITFIGMIMFTEYSYHIKLLMGTDATIPSFAMIMIVREIGPNIAAMLIISRMGAARTAELGVMKTTEQLDAYRLLGLNPIELFVAPQVIASSISTFLLTLISLVSATIGGWIACIWLLNFTTGTFFMNLFVFIKFSDLAFGLSKSFMYGASIPIICATYGFRCEHGAEGVGMATTNAVVAATVWTIMFGFFNTFLFSVFAG